MSPSLLENLGSKRGDFLEGAVDSILLFSIASGVLICWYGTAVGGLPNFLTWSLFVPQVRRRPSTVLLLESRVIEESSIQPPTTLIINALQETAGRIIKTLFPLWLWLNCSSDISASAFSVSHVRSPSCKGLMRAKRIVTIDVATDFSSSLCHVSVVLEIDLLVLQTAPEALYRYVIYARPLPSMLMRTPAAFSGSTNPGQVNCAP